jgi:hypothetical protein
MKNPRLYPALAEKQISSEHLDDDKTVKNIEKPEDAFDRYLDNAHYGGHSGSHESYWSNFAAPCLTRQSVVTSPCMRLILAASTSSSLSMYKASLVFECSVWPKK